MRSRSVEDIEYELKRVDERIHSKESLLKEYPDDVGLQLSIMDFEGLKRDLIRELSDVNNEPSIYTRYIKEKLEETQNILNNTRNLQVVSPEKEGISENIEFLELVEEELITELEYCYLNQNISIYEIRLTGEQLYGSRIPMASLGEILKYTQDVTSSISQSIFSKKKKLLKPVHIKESVQSSFTGKTIIDEKVSDEKESETKSMLSEELIQNSQLYCTAMAKGSVRIILSSPQPTLNNPILDESFAIFKDMVKCGSDKEALKKQIERIGDVEPILQYKHFLSTLFKNKLNIEFSGKTEELNTFDIIKLDYKGARTIFNALNKNDKPLDNNIVKTGVLRAVDLVSNSFKFYEEGDPKKLISGKFTKELSSEIESKKFNEMYTIKLLASLPTDKLKREQKIRYKLLEFID